MAKRKKRMSPQTMTVLAFVIALLVCGGIAAGWLIYTMSPDKTPKPDTDTPTPDTVGDVHSVLLILTDNDAPQFVCLQVDGGNQTVQAVALPPQTARTNDGDTLAALFAEEGASACCKEVANLLNIDTPWYAVMTYEQTQAFIDALPRGLIYDLPEAVSHQTDDYFLRLDMGLQTLTGGQAIKLLRYPSWKQGPLQQVNMHAELVAAWWNQYATADYVGALDADYAAWYDTAQTNLGIAPFTEMKAVLVTLWNQNDGTQCTAVLPKGMFVADGDEKRYLLKG